MRAQIWTPQLGRNGHPGADLRAPKQGRDETKSKIGQVEQVGSGAIDGEKGDRAGKKCVLRFGPLSLGGTGILEQT